MIEPQVNSARRSFLRYGALLAGFVLAGCDSPDTGAVAVPESKTAGNKNRLDLMKNKTAPKPPPRAGRGPGKG
jgi:hypothetical protein